MSQFTNFNGPQQNCMPSASQIEKLLEFIKELTKANGELEALKNTLDEHIADKVSSDDVHDAKTYIDNQTAGLDNRLDAVENAINLLNGPGSDVGSVRQIVANAIGVSESTAAATYALKDTVASLQATVTSLSNTVETLATQTSVAALATQVSLLNQAVQTFAETIENSFSVKVDKTIDYAKFATVKAPYVGTGASSDVNTHGLYVLGMLTEDYEAPTGLESQVTPKPATAYVKYVNDQPFDAIVDMVASNRQQGSMQAICAKASGHWPNMQFVLILGTDSNGAKHVYLAISADNVTAMADHSFYVAGINFAPVGTDEYVALNGTVLTSYAVINMPDGSGTGFSHVDVAAIGIEYMTAQEAEQIWDEAHQ